LLYPAFFLFNSCHHTDNVFTKLSPSETNIHFENKLEKRDLFGILYYLYYYNGGGVAIGDINNDGLPDIYFTANSYGHNKLYINKGNFQFEDITDRAGVAGTADWCSGVTMADVNGDGLLDIYVCAVANHHRKILTGEINGFAKLRDVVRTIFHADNVLVLAQARGSLWLDPDPGQIRHAVENNRNR